MSSSFKEGGIRSCAAEVHALRSGRTSFPALSVAPMEHLDATHGHCSLYVMETNSYFTHCGTDYRPIASADGNRCISHLQQVMSHDHPAFSFARIKYGGNPRNSC